MRVSLLPIDNSIQRWSPSGWSVITRKPTFSVQNATALAWSRTAMPANFSDLIMDVSPDLRPPDEPHSARETRFPIIAIVTDGLRPEPMVWGGCGRGGLFNAVDAEDT